MVLKLYASPVSGCSQRVAAVLLEKQVPFELIPIDLTQRGQKAPEVLAKQPFGQVPYIDDDGFVLYESRAICRYIATKYAHQGTPELIPSDPKAHALFEQAASIEQSNFDALAAPAVFEKLIKPRNGLTPDQALFDSLITRLDAKLDAYDLILSRQKYLAGDEITLADLFHLPYAARLKLAGCNIMETKPNVARWLKEISSRPCWEAVKMGIESTA